MKKNYFLKLLTLLVLGIFSINSISSQTQGDIAFIGFNADGDDDFSIVVLADISANSTLYFTDNESDGTGNITSGEGTLIWTSGSQLIHAGTVINFTDVDNESNPNFGVSIGSLSKTGNFNISPSSKDGLIAYKGSDSSTPTNFIAAIQIGNDSSTLGPFDGDGITLSNTGLVIGTSIIVIDSSASPDGAVYHASRYSEASYSDYYNLLIDDSTNWTNVVNGDGETLLPFSHEAFTIHTTSWTGNSNSVWNSSGNWDNGVPTHSSTVLIPDVSSSPIINSGTEAKAGNITISSGEIVTINTGNALTINGQLTISGMLIINSGSSIISKGTSTGNITYQRNLETNNWYLVSSPVKGETLENLISNHTFATGTGSNIGLATYTNDGNDWNYETATSTGLISSAVGYSAKLTASGDISFTGTIPTTNIDISITSNTNSFNLIGNPYPSYIPANLNASSSSNILTLNSSVLNEETIWFWDQSLNAYTQINQASSARFIAPAQGFFVNSIGNNTFRFTETMQSHQSNDLFQKSNTTRPEIVLSLTDGSITKNTEIYYISGTTSGFDNGFDSSIFNGIENPFAIYTRLVTNENGKNLGIQSLPEDSMEEMIIPIGINASLGAEISISAIASNLPPSVHIYLEDKNNNSFTRLDEINAKYTVTLSNTLDGIGRFFLHTSSNTLDVASSDQKNISLYTSNNNLHIVGIKNGDIHLEVYNILGKQVLKSSFLANNDNTISLPSLKKGIYIIHLQTEAGKTTKKLLIE